MTILHKNVYIELHIILYLNKSDDIHDKKLCLLLHALLSL